MPIISSPALSAAACIFFVLVMYSLAAVRFTLPCLVKNKSSPSSSLSKQAVSLSPFSSWAIVLRFTALPPVLVSAISSAPMVMRFPRLVNSLSFLSVDVSKRHAGRSASFASESRCLLGTLLSLPSGVMDTLTSSAAISASFTSIVGSASNISVALGAEYFSFISLSSPFITSCSL